MSAGQGPADHGRDADAERLAAAIEQGTPPGSAADAGLARDLQIVAMLRSRSSAYDPDPMARADAKQRLMAALAPPDAVERTTPLGRVGASTSAVDDGATTQLPPVVDDAPTEVAEPLPAVSRAEVETPERSPAPRRGRSGRHSLPSRPAGRARGAGRPAARGLRRRVAVVAAAAVAAMVAIAGLGSFASRDSLPGDALYAVKRLSEGTGLALTFDDATRAQRHLELATARIDEVEQLVARQESTGTAASPEVVESAMVAFDESTSEGSRMLLAADEAPGAASLADLRTWAAEQTARLSVLRSALPTAAVEEADGSIALLDRLLGRTEALESRSECSEVTSNAVDDLGPLPADGACEPRPTVEAGDPSSPDAATTDPAEQGTTAPEGTDQVDPTDLGSTSPTPTTPDGSSAPESDEPGLLPDLGTDGLLDDQGGEVPTEGPTTEGEPTDDGGETDGDDGVAVPLPLVPTVQLPPLLPGLPSISIG